jgi:hypothetical protein
MQSRKHRPEAAVRPLHDVAARSIVENLSSVKQALPHGAAKIAGSTPATPNATDAMANPIKMIGAHRTKVRSGSSWRSRNRMLEYMATCVGMTSPNFHFLQTPIGCWGTFQGSCTGEINLFIFEGRRLVAQGLADQRIFDRRWPGASPPSAASGHEPTSALRRTGEKRGEMSNHFTGLSPRPAPRRSKTRPVRPLRIPGAR